jgi:hypothetical protein
MSATDLGHAEARLGESSVNQSNSWWGKWIMRSRAGGQPYCDASASAGATLFVARNHPHGCNLRYGARIMTVNPGIAVKSRPEMAPFCRSVYGTLSGRLAGGSNAPRLDNSLLTYSEVPGIHCQKSHAPALRAGHDQKIVRVSRTFSRRKSEPLERTSFVRHRHGVLVT